MLKYLQDSKEQTGNEIKKVYNVNMNGHSAESYTVVWLFKTCLLYTSRCV